MSGHHVSPTALRSRWSAIGAAVAITLGAGGMGLAEAAIDTGDRPVTVTIAPQRILDTRDDIGLAGAFDDATPRDLQVTGAVPIAPSGTATVVPSDAVAVLVNVTVVRPTAPGFLSLRPAGTAGEPETSTVNFDTGTVEPNAATIDLGPGGKIQIWVETASDTGTAHVLVDVVGYTIDHTHDDRYYTETETDAMIADLTDAQPFAVSDFATSSVALTTGPKVIASVTFTAPVAGQVTVNSSALVGVGEPNEITCTIRMDATPHLMQTFDPGTNDLWANLAGTAQYDVIAGAEHTFDYRCYSITNQGLVESMSGLTAIFTPGG
jgi:hypothetical protein